MQVNYPPLLTRKKKKRYLLYQTMPSSSKANQIWMICVLEMIVDDNHLTQFIQKDEDI